ncbi:hypothetical protein CUJ88_46065 (plasmid) [Paraburkholderia hospita]|nr:hypothetical protein CUJ88_46065 [Paraburkholderia hospita]
MVDHDERPAPPIDRIHEPHTLQLRPNPAFDGSFAPGSAASSVGRSKFMQPECGGIESICREIEELRQAFTKVRASPVAV